MSDECHNQYSIIDVAAAISRRLLRIPEQPIKSDLQLVIAAPSFSQYARSGLKHMRFDVNARNTGLAVEEFAALAGSVWQTRISIINEPVQEFELKINLLWEKLTTNSNHDVWNPSYMSPDSSSGKGSSTVKSPRDDNNSLLAQVFYKTAAFMTGRTHADLDTMTFEASRVAFRACEEHKGLAEVSGVWMKLSRPAGPLQANRPRESFSKIWSFGVEWYQQFQRAENDQLSSSGTTRAMIALGSNVGNRFETIEHACAVMARRGLRLLRTSSLYETEPMYKTDQPSFLNGVCEVETTLPPLELLDQLKDIETTLGRVRTVENGPRTIDLDILLYGNQIVDHQRLKIPHPRIQERDFVLRPLCDIAPHGFLPQPNTLLDFSAQLSRLPPPTTPPSPQTPLTRSTSPSPLLLTSTNPTRKTHLMAILNLTPDSFSSDGLHTPTFTPSSLLPTLDSLLAHNIPILDIGGQSTRPHATPLSATEELARVLPTIEFIRSHPRFNPILLSIDTFHASVARACVQAGADIINDVSAGTLDQDMFPTIAELGCTYIMSHMRGTPQTMNTMTSYPDGIIRGIATELAARVQPAMAAGVFRWRIVLDPGIGFAKTLEQNLEVLRRLRELRAWEGLSGLPWCVGLSRKAFVGRVTGTIAREEERVHQAAAEEGGRGAKAKEGEAAGAEEKKVAGAKEDELRQRIWGTAAGVAASVAGGADVVRVHDWVEMGKVVRMGDAVWRRV
ncbi:MAG: hypothetical protein Q9219_004749 [cf. Caloplaca sp. 3 TL-2023]